MIKEVFTALHPDENILHFNVDSGYVEFSCNEMGVLNIDLNNNFDEDDPDTITNSRLLL